MIHILGSSDTVPPPLDKDPRGFPGCRDDAYIGFIKYSPSNHGCGSSRLSRLQTRYMIWMRILRTSQAADTIHDLSVLDKILPNNKDRCWTYVRTHPGAAKYLLPYPRQLLPHCFLDTQIHTVALVLCRKRLAHTVKLQLTKSHAPEVLVGAQVEEADAAAAGARGDQWAQELE